MQPLKSIAPQWEAKDKKLRPVFPKPVFDYQFPPDGPSGSLLASAEVNFDVRIAEWNKCQETAKLHEFDTDLPDRIYYADELNEVVWQKHSKVNDTWVECDDDSSEYEEYRGYSYPMETRQFVTLKQPTQTTN